MGKKIAITGATGYVGKFVVPLLVQNGYSVRALVRPASDRSGFSHSLSSDIEWVIGSITDNAARQTLVDHVDAVVHLAYSHEPGRYRGGEGNDLAAWLSVNLHASLDLLLDARNASVSQFIFLSSRAVFSHTEPGRTLDETHPISPDTHYGAYKAAIESMLRSFAAVEGMYTTALRATGIYGLIWPVEQSKWWQIIQSVLANEPVMNNRGGTEVHGGDVAQVIGTLLEKPANAPELLHLSDLYVTTRQIVEIAQRIADRSGPLPPLPDKPMTNALACPQLADLGLKLGGEALLEETIRQLVSAANA